MKEKLLKALGAITGYHIIAWFNLVLFGYQTCLSIWHHSWDCFILCLPFMLIALLAFDLVAHEKNLRGAKEVAALTSMIGIRLISDLEKYKKLYGDLPKEESKTEELKKE